MGELVGELGSSLGHLLFEGGLLLGGLLLSSESSSFISLGLGGGSLSKMRLLFLEGFLVSSLLLSLLSGELGLVRLVDLLGSFHLGLSCFQVIGSSLLGSSLSLLSGLFFGVSSFLSLVSESSLLFLG